MEKDWLSPQEIADELGLKVDTIREYIRKKELIAHKFGREYRIHHTDYVDWLKKRRTSWLVHFTKSPEILPTSPYKNDTL